MCVTWAFLPTAPLKRLKGTTSFLPTTFFRYCLARLTWRCLIACAVSRVFCKTNNFSFLFINSRYFEVKAGANCVDNNTASGSTLSANHPTVLDTTGSKLDLSKIN